MLIQGPFSCGLMNGPVELMGLVVAAPAEVEASAVFFIVAVFVVATAAKVLLVVLGVTILVVTTAAKVALVIFRVAVLVVAASAKVDHLRGSVESEASHCIFL